MRNRHPLTHELLRQHVHYDPATGEFTWLIAKCGRDMGRNAAGHYTRDGRRTLQLFGVKYTANRLAWLYVTGAWPTGVIDHRNGNTKDDRFDNYRDVPTGVNTQNRHRPKAGKELPLGVTKRRSGRFVAKITFEGRSHHKGTFDTPEEAHSAYLLAKRAMHVGCTI